MKRYRRPCSCGSVLRRRTSRPATPAEVQDDPYRADDEACTWTTIRCSDCGAALGSFLVPDAKAAR